MSDLENRVSDADYQTARRRLYDLYPEPVEGVMTQAALDVVAYYVARSYTVEREALRREILNELPDRFPESVPAVAKAFALGLAVAVCFLQNVTRADA